MATLVKRGAGTPTTSGATWTTPANAVDGTPPANPATYAVFTNAVAAGTGYIEITGYDFSAIPSGATINSVNVSIRQLCGSPTSRWTSVQYQPYDGATAIGTIQTGVLSTTARNDNANFSATLAQVQSATFKVRVTAVHAGTQSSTFSLDHADVTVTYTPLSVTASRTTTWSTIGRVTATRTTTWTTCTPVSPAARTTTWAVLVTAPPAGGATWSDDTFTNINSGGSYYTIGGGGDTWVPATPVGIKENYGFESVQSFRNDVQTAGDQYVEIDVPEMGAAWRLGFRGGLSSTGTLQNGYTIQFGGGIYAQFYDSTGTQQHYDAPTGVTGPGTIRGECKGTVVTVYANGTQIAQWDYSATPSTGLYTGFGSSNNTVITHAEGGALVSTWQYDFTDDPDGQPAGWTTIGGLEVDPATVISGVYRCPASYWHSLVRPNAVLTTRSVYARAEYVFVSAVTTIEFGVLNSDNTDQSGVRLADNGQIFFLHEAGGNIVGSWTPPAVGVPFIIEFFWDNSAVTVNLNGTLIASAPSSYDVTTPTYISTGMAGTMGLRKWSSGDYVKPFDPTSITNLAVWVDASVAADFTLSGTNITQWNDKSGNGHNLVAISAGTPPTRTGTQNGLAVTTWSGGPLVLGTTYTLPNQPHTWFIVAKVVSNSWAGVMDTGNLYGIRRIYDNTLQFNMGNGVSYPMDNTGYHVIVGVFDGNGSASQQRIDRVQLGTTNTGNYTPTTYWGLGGDNDGNRLDGNIAEAGFYSKVLSPAELTQLESYLTAKWAVAAPTPVTASRTTTWGVAAATPFDPTAITNLATWFDASVAGDLVLSGTSVTRWNDRSGNSRWIRPSSGGANPTFPGATQNGKTTVRWDGSARLSSEDTWLANPGQPLTYFIVAKLESTGYTGLIGGFTPGGVQGIRRNGSNGQLDFDWGSGSAVSYPMDATGYHVIVAVVNGASSQQRIDSVQVGTGNVGSGTAPDFGIGMDADANKMTGNIAECGVYTKALSPAEITSLEGYLTAKWIVAAPIPTTGLQAWYDADDASTFSFSSGVVVSQWRDKSAGAHHLNGGLLHRDGTVNGRTCVVASDGHWGSAVTSAQVMSVTDNFAMFVVCRRTGGTGDSIPLYNGSANNNGYGPAVRVGGNGPGFLRGGVAWHGSSVVDDGSTMVHTLERVAGTWGHYVNGTATSAAGATGAPNAPTTETSVPDTEGSHDFYGDLCEIVMYDRALTTTERQQVESYLNTKWLAAPATTPVTATRTTTWAVVTPAVPVVINRGEATNGWSSGGAQQRISLSAFTPAAGSLLVCMPQAQIHTVPAGTLGIRPPTDTFGDTGGTAWVQSATSNRGSVAAGQYGESCDIWTRKVGTSPGSGVITVLANFDGSGTPTTDNGSMWMAVAEVPAAYAGSIGAVANQTPVSGTTSYDIVLGSAPAADSVVFSGYMQDFANSKQYTLPTGFTLLHDAYDSTAQMIDAAAYKVGSVTQTHTWSGLEAVNRRLGCAVEIKVPVLAGVYSDDFNRANGALGSPWVVVEGGLTVASNKCVAPNGSVNTSRYNQTFAANQWAEADVLGRPANASSMGPAVRINSSTGDLIYMWLANTSPHLEVWKRISGSYTLVAESAAAPPASFKGRLEAEGSTIRAYVDGTLVATGTASDSTLAAGQPGVLGANGTSSELDNFRAGDLPYVPAGGGTTPVTATRTTTWLVRAEVKPSRTTTWNVAAAVAAPTSDNFTYTDGALTTVGAANWSTTTGFASPVVVSGEVNGLVNGAFQYAVWNYPVTGDQVISFDITPHDTGNFTIAALLRWNKATNSGYRLSPNGNLIERWDSGTPTTLALLYTTNPYLNNGVTERMAFSCSAAGVLTIKDHTGAVLVSATDTTYVANTGVGFGSYGQYGALVDYDNWSVGTAPVSASRTTTWNVAAPAVENFVFYPFTQADGPLASPWFAGGANQVNVVGNRAQSIVANLDEVSGNTTTGVVTTGDFQIDFDCWAPLITGDGYVAVWVVNPATYDGYAVLISNAVHIYPIHGGSYSNPGYIANVGRPGEGSAGGLRNHVTFTRRASDGLMRVFLDGVGWAGATNNSQVQTNGIVINLRTKNYPSEASWIDNLRISDTITGPPAPTTPVLVSRTTRWNVGYFLWKGVGGGWSDTTTADNALLNISWWYDWLNPGSEEWHFDDADPLHQYVPMQWGDWERDYGYDIGSAPGTYPNPSNILLGFNEPDDSGQSGVSVDRALALWPQLEATGYRLGSPAPAIGGEGWLASFMSGNGGPVPRVDFICVHWYSDYNGGKTLAQHLDYYHTTYPTKPIWLTEVGALWAGVDANATLIPQVMAVLATRPWVERVGWFSARDTDTLDSGLVDSGGTLNAAGTVFAGYPKFIGATTQVTASRTTTWATRSTVSLAKTTTWATRANITTASRTTTWANLAKVTPARTTTWTALAPVSAGRTTTWSSLSKGTTTRTTTWTTLAPVSATRTTTWSQQAQVLPSRTTTWNTAAPVGTVSASRTTTWTTSAPVTATKTTSWSTLAPVAAATRTTTWRVAAVVTATRTTTWNTLATALPKVATLVDTFDTTVSTTTWKDSSPAVVWDATGQAKIPVATSYWALQTGLTTGQAYDLTASSFFAKVVCPAVGNGSREILMSVFNQSATPQNDKLVFIVSGTSLIARQVVSGSLTTLATVTYSPTNHAWWRIRETGGTVFFDTSPNSVTWTNVITTPAPAWANKVAVGFSAGYWGTETASDAFVDNINFGISPVSASRTTTWSVAGTLTTVSASRTTTWTARALVGSLQRLAIPSYFWVTWYNAPAGNHEWERMQSAVPTQQIAIVNPNSGPDEATGLQTDWVHQITDAHAAGLKVLGYIKTGYSTKAAAVAKHEVDLYYSWYDVDGIFFDETSYEAGAKQAYYADLYAYVKTKTTRSRTVAINPGIPGIDESYMAACDITMNYEGPASSYASASFPAWVANYPASRFWHCIHDVTSEAQRDTLIGQTRTNNAGYVYLTTDSTVTGDLNPYNSLPAEPFWTNMLRAVALNPSRTTTWNVAAPVTQVTATRTTTWAVRTPVSAATRTTTWSVLVPVVGTASRTTTWANLSTFTTTRSTTWTALAPVTPVARTTTWFVKTQVLVTRTTTWSTFNPPGVVTASRTTTWNTGGSIQVAKTTTWAVLRPVVGTATRTTTWAVLTPVSAVRTTQWVARSALVTTRTTTWAALAPVALNRTTTWATLSIRTIGRTTTWTALAPIAGVASRTTTWGTRQAITTGRTTTWRVFAPTTGILVVRTTLWIVRARANATRTTTWRVLPGVPQHDYLTLYPTTVMYLGTHRIKALYQGNVKVWP